VNRNGWTAPAPLGMTNFRDIGGYKSRLGGWVKTGVVYRSEVLAFPGASSRHSIFDEQYAQVFRDLGIRSIVDLRSLEEAEAVASAWKVATGAAVLARPIAPGGEGPHGFIGPLVAGSMKKFDADDLAAFYIETLGAYGSTFAGIFTHIAHHGARPTVIHCSAGKDRTGMTVALLHEILGVSRADLLTDYTLTEKLRPDRINAYADIFGAAGISLDDVRTLFDTPATAMEAALDHVGRTYGSVETYLIEHSGMASETVERLRSDLITPR
jgi:protein-tyrosine phosphatase